MELPTHFKIGIGRRQVPNAALKHVGKPGTVSTFQGLVGDYDFAKQKKNFDTLSEVLSCNGDWMTFVAAAHFKGDLHINHRFDVLTESGNLIWHKYVGYVAQSGQNHVFVGGMAIKLSVFLALNSTEQRTLLSGSKLWINLIFPQERIKYLDESHLRRA